MAGAPFNPRLALETLGGVRNSDRASWMFTHRGVTVEFTDYAVRMCDTLEQLEGVLEGVIRSADREADRRAEMAIGTAEGDYMAVQEPPQRSIRQIIDDYQAALDRYHQTMAQRMPIHTYGDIARATYPFWRSQPVSSTSISTLDKDSFLKIWDDLYGPGVPADYKMPKGM